MTRSEPDLRLIPDIDLPRFWRLFEARHPEEARRSTLRQRRNRQWPLPDFGLVVTLYLSEADGHAGVFFGLNARVGADRTRLDPVADRVRERLEERPYTPAPFWRYGSIWLVDLRDKHN